MAKKVRRVKKSTPAAAPRQDSVAAGVVAAEETEAGKPASAAEQFRQEYAYVLKDLSRVALLAGAMFLLLIAANLLLG